MMMKRKQGGKDEKGGEKSADVNLILFVLFCKSSNTASIDVQIGKQQGEGEEEGEGEGREEWTQNEGRKAKRQVLEK